MLSDEEKKEYIEHEILDRLYCLEENDFDKNKVDDGYIKAVLNACKEAKNLIEKQSKEIEILNKNMNLLREQNISYKQSIHGLKEMNKIINKKWEDKIKAKIEELDKEEKENLKGTKGQDRYAIKQEYMYKRSVLQSLLEKE